MSEAGFELDPRLAESSAPVGDLGLCQARLQLDARFVWIVLVPRRSGARELHDLDETDRRRLLDEVVMAGHALTAAASNALRPVRKLNVGALGNVVAQLHVHVVGRREDDAAWPGPVWGFPGAKAYGEADLARTLKAVRQGLGLPVAGAT